MPSQYTPELVEVLDRLPADDADIQARMDAALSEVRPDLCGVSTWYRVPGSEASALGIPGGVSDVDAEVLYRAYRVARGAHESCLACFLASRAPFCAAGDCTAGE